MTKRPASATRKPAPATDDANAAEAAPAPVELITVVAKKAFLGPTGWVQPGEETDVTPSRKRDLARNGLINGEDADNDDVQPLGSARDKTRKIHVTGGAGDQTEENT